MNTKYLLTAAAAAAVTLGATALSYEAGMQERTVQTPQLSVTAQAPRALGAKKATAPRMEVYRLTQTRAEEEATDLLCDTLLVNNFDSDLCMQGSEDEPKIENPSCFAQTSVYIQEHPDEYPYPAWFKLKKESFGDGKVWGGNNLYPAGGAIALVNKQAYGITESNIIPPFQDCLEKSADYEGIIRIKFRARVGGGDSGDGTVVVEAVDTGDAWETQDVDWDWNILGAGQAKVTSSWATFEAVFYGGGPNTMINIYNMCGKTILIDDLRVYQKEQIAHTPILKPYSDFTGPTWTANWEKAKNAEGYLIDIYSVETSYDGYGYPTGEKVTYLKQDEKIESGDTESYAVTDAEPGVKYFYTVRSTKGDFVSLPQPAMSVFQLLPTKMHPVTDLSEDNTYTASWDAIAGAERYNYWARFKNVAEADGTFVITDEDFTGVVDADGFPTNWTKENPESLCYSEYYYSTCKQAGWRGLNTAPYTDYICFDVWQYLYNNSDAGYISPEMDLSKDGGKVSVSVDVAGAYFGYDDPETGQHIGGCPHLLAVIFSWNEELGDWEQTELHRFEGVKEDWGHAEFTLTTGKERSMIGLYGAYSPENLYLDNLKVTQEYKKGDYLMDPHYFGRFLEGTEVKVNVQDRAANKELYHQVCGVTSEIVQTLIGNTVEFLMSPLTEMELVAGSDKDWSGVQTPTLSNATVQVNGDVVTINNPEGAEIVITDLGGIVEYRNTTGAGSVTLTLPDGIHMISVGGRTVKLVL